MAEEDSSPSSLRYPAWQRAYEAALLELDRKKLLERVHTAEAVIFNRLQALAQIPDSPEHAAERQAMEDALNALRVLKRNKLNFPDWEKK